MTVMRCLRDAVTLNARQFRYVLLLDSLLFIGTALIDLVLSGSGQLAGGLLRIVIGIVNVAAYVHIHRELTARTAAEYYAPNLKAWEFPSVVAAQASAIPLLIVPFVIEFTGTLHDGIDISIVSLTGVLLVAAMATSLGALLTRPRSLNLTWGIVVAVLPLVGLLQFWYMTFYRPAHQRPTVNVVAKLDQAGLDQTGHHGGIRRMQGEVTLENAGNAELDVLDAVYTVTGFDAGPSSHLMTRDETKDTLNSRDWVAWRDGTGYQGLLDVGRLIRPGGHLTPGQKLVTSFAFDVKDGGPEPEPEKLRLTVFLSVMAHGTDDLENVSNCPAGDPEAADACHQVTLPRESFVRDILGDSPVARVYFQAPSKGLPVPHLTTKFLAVSWNNTTENTTAALQRVDPYRVSRGFTTSIEVGLDP
jgi:hypothetical protein